MTNGRLTAAAPGAVYFYLIMFGKAHDSPRWVALAERPWR